MSEHTIKILVNGEEREIPSGTTVAGLLQMLSLDRRRVAVEQNRDIVPRDRYEATVLGSGDHLEIVTFVGGG